MTPAIVGVALSIPFLLADPPEEIRAGSLDGRGITFRAKRPNYMGDDVWRVGDVNGDGLADFLLRRYTAGDDGQVCLVYGRRDFPAIVEAEDLDGYSTVMVHAPWGQGSDPALRGFAAAGDLDGDGFDDFFVLRGGASLPEDTSPDYHPGLVHLVMGARVLPLSLDLDAPEGARVTTFTSKRPVSTSLCQSIALGDWNGDGVRDIAFGVPFDRGTSMEEAGRVHVLLGPIPIDGGVVDLQTIGAGLPGFIIEGGDFWGLFGWAVASAGDPNGDGIDDLLIGTDSGDALLLYGTREERPALSTSKDAVLGGRAALFSSSTRETRGFAAPGDLNGDGFDDFLIGSAFAGSGAGAVYLVYGKPGLTGEVPLGRLVDLGLGVSFAGEPIPVEHPNIDHNTGKYLDLLDFDGDGSLEVLVTAPRFTTPRAARTGKAYLLALRAFEPGERSFAEIEGGTLPGSLFTADLTVGLSTGAAAPGDVNGDGIDDLLLSAPLAPDGDFAIFSKLSEVETNVYLLLGSKPGSEPLALEAVVPDSTGLAGGEELTLIGAGFDENVRVTIAGAEARVARVTTTARMTVEAPPGHGLGLADILVRKGGQTAMLPGGLRYLPRVYPDIRVDEIAASGRGTELSMESSPSIAFVDIDADGFSDLFMAGERRILCLYGRPGLPVKVDLRDLDAGGRKALGVALFPSDMDYMRLFEAGDVNGDGIQDLGVHAESSSITIIFGGERYPDGASVDDLERQGKAAKIFYGGNGPGVRLDVGGNGDFNGDGIGDLVFGWAFATELEHSRAYWIPGKRTWPREQYLDDFPRIESSYLDDQLGHAVAFVGDIDGDRYGEILLGAEGAQGRDAGRGYLLFGAPEGFGNATILDDLIAAGRALELAAVKERDGLGHDACGLGDFDGDGVTDFGITAEFGGAQNAGETYVVFGRKALRGRLPGAPLELGSLGGGGVRILGEQQGDYAMEAAPAGDFNGDSLKDLLVYAYATFRPEPRAYVLLGGAAGTRDLSALGANGFRILGDPGRPTGNGDFNGDGLSDVVFSLASRENPGEARTYILFGEGAGLPFLRGDTNGDSRLDLSDAVSLLGSLFLGNAPPPCNDAADSNDDGKLDLSDAIYVLGHLFLGGPAPPAPFPKAGVDPTPDELDCRRNR